MAEVTGEEGTPVPAPALTVSGSFREGSRSSARRRTLSGASNAPPAMRRGSFNADNEFMTLLHSSDPVKVELNRLENEVRDKNRELGEAQAEIKALRLSERLRVKAVEEVPY